MSATRNHVAHTGARMSSTGGHVPRLETENLQAAADMSSRRGGGMAALSPSPPRPERRPLWLGGLEREYLCSELWSAVASVVRSTLRVRESVE